MRIGAGERPITDKPYYARAYVTTEDTFRVPGRIARLL